jgi:hypothetical protein
MCVLPCFMRPRTCRVESVDLPAVGLHDVEVRIGSWCRSGSRAAKCPCRGAWWSGIELRGTFRFHAEFALAVALIGGGLADVMSLLTETVPLADACAAFELAADPSHATKVQLAFTCLLRLSRTREPCRNHPPGYPYLVKLP